LKSIFLSESLVEFCFGDDLCCAKWEVRDHSTDRCRQRAIIGYEQVHIGQRDNVLAVTEPAISKSSTSLPAIERQPSLDSNAREVLILAFPKKRVFFSRGNCSPIWNQQRQEAPNHDFVQTPKHLLCEPARSVVLTVAFLCLEVITEAYIHWVIVPECLHVPYECPRVPVVARNCSADFVQIGEHLRKAAQSWQSRMGNA
jgi:hypothetical protein